MMNTNVGTSIRMSEFLDSRDHRALLLDLTIASSFGAVAGLEDIAKTLSQCNEIFDGIIMNPGQLEHHAHLLGGKLRSSPLVRVDWTNAARGNDPGLPALKVTRVQLSDAEDALRLGASATVATLLLGYDEEMEAENIRSVSRLALECYRLSLPVIADIRPMGGRVTADNFAGSIKLGVSFMMEAGADALIVPACDKETLSLIGSWSTVPVLVRLENLARPEEIQELFALGMSGIVFTEKILAVSGFEGIVGSLRHLVH